VTEALPQSTRTSFVAPLADRGAQRIVRCVGGLVLFGGGVGLQKQAALGLPPWDVFHEGFSETIGWPFGRALILTSFIVLLLWIPLRQRPGLGTLFNAVEIGLVADVVIALVPHPDAMGLRIAMMATGIALVGVGSGFYIGSGLGPGPRDGLMTGLAARGWRVSRARTSVEVAVLLIGWLLGGSVGAGTLVFAIVIGPIVQRTIPALSIRPIGGPPSGADDRAPWTE
jgi:uncharacterized membrane protein YczE